MVPTLEQRIVLFNLLTEQNVDKVYSGRPGCGCGCRGKYSTTVRMIRTAIKAMREAPDKVVFGATFDGLSVLALEGETRYRWVYVKTPVYDQLIAFINNPLPAEVAV